MGKLEDRIVASLAMLREGEPDGAAEPMFVLPTSLMTLGASLGPQELRVVRHGEVAMIRRRTECDEASL